MTLLSDRDYELLLRTLEKALEGGIDARDALVRLRVAHMDGLARQTARAANPCMFFRRQAD